MSSAANTEQMVKEAESLLLHHFRTEPFHNLHLLFNDGKPLAMPGGTCSDKTLSYLRDARQLGFQANLHTAYIGGQEIHRLVRIHIGEKIYFADVGNGWPSTRLFPADKPIKYQSFGMNYRSEINGVHISIYHEKQGVESLQMIIDTTPRTEEQILEEMSARYTSGIRYPFSNSVRFSMIVADRFLFLRGDQLTRYSIDKWESTNHSSKGTVRLITEHFNINLPELPAMN